MTGAIRAVAAFGVVALLAAPTVAQEPAAGRSWFSAGSRGNSARTTTPSAAMIATSRSLSVAELGETKPARPSRSGAAVAPAMPMSRAAAMAASPGPESGMPEAVVVKPAAMIEELPVTIVVGARLLDDVFPIPAIPPDTAEPPLADSTIQRVSLRTPSLSPLLLDTAPRLPVAYTMQFPPPLVSVVEPSARAARALAALSEPASADRRRRAADELNELDLLSAPELERKLIAGARQRCTVDERLAFVRALVRGKATQPEVFDLLNGLVNDDTPALRNEAAIGLMRLRQSAAAH